jgi:hypothetical protein
MLKRLMVLLVFALLLVACSGVQPVSDSDAPAPEAQSKPTEADPIAVVSLPTETAGPEPGDAVAPIGSQMECTLVSDQPDAPAELVAIFGVTKNDWVEGPETAAVTIVEYSDFQ